jgi:PA14 domain
MIYRLSSHYQKEIALSLLSVFIIPVMGEVKAQLLNSSNQRNVQFAYSNGSKKYDRSLTADANDAQSFGFFPSTGDDEKDKGKKPKQPQSNLQNFSGEQNRKFDKAFIGGPSQPEMTSFKSVGSDNMVSPFTGDFSYNLPLLDVGGYPINMFYSSGITMDQEASWVGLGWNINPGTITRNMRGLPDDFNGSDIITKTQSFRNDKTFGLTVGGNIKIAGFPLSIGANMGLAWNNKLGVSAEAGINAALSISSKNATLKTYNLTVGAGLNASSRSGASYSPSITLQKEMGKGSSGNMNGSIGVGYNYSSRIGLTSHLDMNVSGALNKDIYGSIGGSTTLSYAYPSVVPSITKPFTRENYSLELSMGGELYSVNLHGKIKGYYSRTFLADEDKKTYHPAYGMLYLQGANNNKDALLDFNRANDGVYTPNTPTIAMPVYTYDVFSINGEGTGGSFRAYRGDVGHMRDATVKTKENAFGLGVDLGFGNMVHVGADLNYVYSPTETGDWVSNNMASPAFSFQPNNKDYQAVYFKNPSEKTVPDAGFQTAMSGDDLVRFKMINTASANPMLLPNLIRYDATKNVLLPEKTITANDTKKMNRDKRTQVISFLTAQESERVGMNSKLYSYNAQGSYENKIIFSVNCNKAGIDSFYRNQDVNHFPAGPHYLGGEFQAFRHMYHISEIDVLGSDGKKYEYGLPVYNKKQYNVTFSIDQSQKASDTKAVYDADDNTVSNTKGRDWIMEKEEIPAYTHSYLLTELTSPNYVDMTGNGITEDDMGDAVKFNYSKYNDYKWRTPVGKPGEPNTASYSSGLKTDEKDDKAHYVYGEREQWYLYSVESKNMVARFYVKSDRKDGRPVVDENGTLDPDASNGMKRLDKISLFSKGDLTRYGDNAKPIKTIRFFQSYKLCKNTPASSELGSNIDSAQGKLTLDSIWISYNGNTRKPKSKYVFYYPDNNNPNYSFEQNDRWGTFKPKTDNPDINLTNEDYPYSTQDQVKADKNAAAWAMNKILLPSGGVINVDYESDSYGYVQSKKAASMCQVLGFGTSEISLPAAGELSKLYSNGGIENDKVYIKLPYAINATGPAGKTEFASRYLEDVKQLYLKLAVTMPTGSGLSGIAGEETIPVYADIAGSGSGSGYGLINSTTAWIKVADIGTGHTPMVQSALQFLTQQLPGKAYKGYDLSDEGGFKSIVMAMGGMINSIGSMFNGEINTLKNDLKCQQVVLFKCFAKLTNPTRNKLGGGHRVKRIVISDNWDKMTGQRKATYGKEYRYTTTELINGKLETISSGVASWEPSIGGDENPNREIMRFVDHNKGGPYDYGSIEMPLGEMFYPSPTVGYSRVEVLSIHRDTVKNQPTRQVTEFYTNKDFPYKSSCTDLAGDANARYEPAKIMQLLRIDMMKGIAQSQGFLVETNDMNGKEKSDATYTVNDPVNPVNYTQYFYNTKQVTDKSYSFNHNFPVISSADGKVTNALIGKDVEVMTDFREHRSETITANLSINFDGFIVGFFPIPLTNLLQPVVREGTAYRSAAILKLVTHYGIMDSVVVVDKGSMVSTKNLVYDAETGNPLLTRTQNEHNKPVYNFSYPAHWTYSGMGLAYRNIDAAYSGLEFRHGILTNPPAGIFDVLESGDEIYVDVRNNSLLSPQLPCDGALNKNNPWDTLRTTANTFKIWAVNMQKAGAVNPEWVFMDANGNPFNAALGPDLKGAAIRIIRSGKRNMLDQSVAAITSMNYPVVNGQLVFNEATKIISTTAATFKDNWRVDNSFYKVTETVDSSAYARVKRADFGSNGFANISRDQYYGGDDIRTVRLGNGIDLYNTTWGRDKKNGNCGWKYTKKHNIVGFLLYDYSALPVTSLSYKALLSLESHTNNRYPTSSGYPPASHLMVGKNDNDCFNSSPHHNSTVSQNNNGLLAEIQGLKQGWYSTTKSPDENNDDPNAYPWVNNYFYNSNNLTPGKGIIPYSTSGWSDYINDSKVNVTLPLLGTVGTTLGNQRKLGLSLRLANFNYEPGAKQSRQVDYRCFWSPAAPGPCYNIASRSYASNNSVPNCTGFASPKLSYYYYNWGDTLFQYGYANDPSVNVMLTKYISTVTATYCKSKFDRKAMNPYVEGVLGNWRVDSTYAYYGERIESDPTTPQIDTRVAGAIKNYKTFWSFAATPVIPNTPVYLSRNLQATDVWVWNSAITQYNRKGYEIENTDPLGRFNAGLYGYNQQLPVAIANNARVREVLFDGFEDYDYQTASNCITCKPHKAFNYTTAITPQIDATQHHTGRYSLKLNSNSNIKIQAPVTSATEANRAYGLKLQNKTNAFINQGLGAGGTYGTGLKASWYNHAVSGQYSLPLEPAPSTTYPQAALIYTQNAVYPEGLTAPQLGSMGVATEYFSVKWEGKIQAPVTGTYYFKTPVLDNGYRLRINGNTISQQVQWTNGVNNQQLVSNGFAMVVGQVYNIEVAFYNQWGPQGFQLQWKIPNSNSFVKIPLAHLYMPNATAFRQVDTIQYACYRLDSSQVTGNALTDSFSLIQSRKMLLSAWVKVGTVNCCFPATYDNGSNSISIGWDQSGWISNVFKPAGPVIEGWQRYEGVFDVPAGVPSVTITLNNTGSSSPVFFDDLRIQPYNSNMKSYVYHSSNLRLMAELDENNYSSLYEYDDDGTLTRVKKETQLGIKTITETRSATQKKVNEP